MSSFRYVANIPHAVHLAGNDVLLSPNGIVDLPANDPYVIRLLARGVLVGVNLIPTPVITCLDDLNNDGVLGDSELGNYPTFAIHVPESIDVSQDGIHVSVSGMFDARFPLAGIPIVNGVIVIPAPTQNGQSTTVSASFVVGGVEGQIATKTILARGLSFSFPLTPNGDGLINNVDYVPELPVRLNIHAESLGKTWHISDPLFDAKTGVVTTDDVNAGYVATTFPLYGENYNFTAHVDSVSQVGVLVNASIIVSVNPIQAFIPDIDANASYLSQPSLASSATVRVPLVEGLTAGLTVHLPFAMTRGGFGVANSLLESVITGDDISAGFVDIEVGLSRGNGIDGMYFYGAGIVDTNHPVIGGRPATVVGLTMPSLDYR